MKERKSLLKRNALNWLNRKKDVEAKLNMKRIGIINTLQRLEV